MTVQPIGALDLAYARPVTMAFGAWWRYRISGVEWPGLSRKKIVAPGARGVVGFPSCRLEWRVMDVARSALSRSRVAAEQANAPDRGHERCQIPSRGRAAGDWRRSAVSLYCL
jgi:hypothetical protein